MKVEFCDDGSVWVEYKPGRKRWLPKGHEIAVAAKAGQRLRLDALKADKKQGRFAPGTHEPVVYYRDESGINIPPNPNELPPGVERLEIRTLRDADKLCREMSQELKQRFEFDCTDILDDMNRDQNGNTPRDVIVHEHNHAKTDYGREVTGQMLKVLDKEADDRRKINTDVRFAWRD
jgi:hypothetical protein